jgi:uncharacterized membrane protein/nitrite reductase/ring-hydroxylating ferredoxin subunit
MAPDPLRPVKNLLQGRPFGHPLHSLLVHLPIGLFTLSLLFDVATRLLEPDNRLVQGAAYTMGLGLLAAFAAALTGAADWAELRTDHPARRIANTHMLLNLLAVGLYVLNFVLRLPALDAPAVPWLPFGLSLLGMGLLSYSGYLGGRLVYEDGIGVGRHRRPTALPERTLPGTQLDQGPGVAVARAGDVAPGETLRVEVNGVVIAIANVDGQFYAFQEFCTHRYGPLSEGRIQAGQVECPWHRSCFDVRTGKVTQGPAKVDLRTFPVTVVDGLVRVSAPAENGGTAGRGQVAQEQPERGDRRRQPTPT